MESDTSYLQWIEKETRTAWWHDSADPPELERALEHGAAGVTTNPMLTYRSLAKNAALWRDHLLRLPQDMDPNDRAEAYARCVLTHAAKMLEPQYEATQHALGYVCAQVDPAIAGDREPMLAMAKRFHEWAPNITVKLPASAAGLDVLEECIALGISTTATVSFTVSQAIAVAERYRNGRARAQKNGTERGQCFAVIMIGRLDDYLRDIAHDANANVSESDIRQAGLAITKRVCAIFAERGYELLLIVAALRGAYHMVELAGAPVVMSIAPPYQDILLQPGVPRELRNENPVPADVVERLRRMPEFVRAYEPDAMRPDEFLPFGLTQRTLTQFAESGWLKLRSYRRP